MNLVEELKQENQAVRLEIQRMRDENNRLKGEQGKPTIKPNKKGRDHSSEKEREPKKPPSPHEKRLPHSEVTVAREEKVAETSKKLGVTFYQYVRDCLSHANEMPALAAVIRSRGACTCLSWIYATFLGK